MIMSISYSIHLVMHINEHCINHHQHHHQQPKTTTNNPFTANPCFLKGTRQNNTIQYHLTIPCHRIASHLKEQGTYCIYLQYYLIVDDTYNTYIYLPTSIVPHTHLPHRFVLISGREARLSVRVGRKRMRGGRRGLDGRKNGILLIHYFFSKV